MYAVSELLVKTCLYYALGHRTYCLNCVVKLVFVLVLLGGLLSPSMLAQDGGSPTRSCAKPMKLTADGAQLYGQMMATTVKLSRSLLDSGKFDEVLAISKRHPTIWDRDATLQALLAAAHFGLGERDAAILALRRALELDPCDAEARSDLDALLNWPSKCPVLPQHKPVTAMSFDELSKSKSASLTFKLQIGQFDQALEMSLHDSPDVINTSDYQTGLGEAHYGLTEMKAAGAAFNLAISLDHCNARAHYDAWVYLAMRGNAREAKTQLDLAHQLSPFETDIKRAWNNLNGFPGWDLSPSNDEEIGTDTGCRITQGPAATTIDLSTVPDNTGGYKAIATHAEVNHVKATLQIDTGDGGITITKALADKAHLPLTAGLILTGAGGLTRPALSAQIQELKFGSLTLEHCPAVVVEGKDIGFDGSIGLYPLRDYQISLDIRHHSMDLEKLPGESSDPIPATEARQYPEIASAAGDTKPASQPAQVIPIDITPTGHRIFIPAIAGGQKPELFLFDTGASTSFIAPWLAQSITRLIPAPEIKVHGSAGMVSSVYRAEDVTLQFGQIRKHYAPMYSINDDIERTPLALWPAGTIGLDLLKDFVISINYRDHVLFLTPNH
jgi:Flp pilus assembly protein TadD